MYARLARYRADIHQFARFVAVGVLNTAFSYGLYALFLSFGAPYAIANLMSLVFGVLFSFSMQGRFVFANRERGRLLRFAGVWALLYVVNVLLIERFVALGFDAYASGALALPPMVLLSYLAQKFFVFRTSATRPDAI